MNLQKLFEIQAKLDKHIVEEKGLEGQDLLDEKILALQVELGELANEWRGFKFWSENSQRRTKIEHLCPYCDKGRARDDFSPHLTDECSICDGNYVLGFSNPMLTEYVDCLHFILSIGLEMKLRKDIIIIDSDYTKETLTETFNEMFFAVSELKNDIKEHSMFTQKETYDALFNLFVGLGEMLGFTWDQIEQAYLDKNKVNHERQDNGY